MGCTIKRHSSLEDASHEKPEILYQLDKWLKDTVASIAVGIEFGSTALLLQEHLSFRAFFLIFHIEIVLSYLAFIQIINNRSL